MYDFKIFCTWLWCLPMLHRTCICFWGHLDTVLVPWVLLERQWHQRFRGKGTLSLVASSFSLWLDASVDAMCRLGGVQNPLPNQKLLMQVLKASPSNLVANTASMLQMISDGCFASTTPFPSHRNRILTYSHSRGVSSQAVYLAWTWALLHLHIIFKQVLLIQLLQFWGHGSCWQWCFRKHQLGRIPGIHSAHPGGGDARSNEAPSIVVMCISFKKQVPHDIAIHAGGRAESPEEETIAGGDFAENHCENVIQCVPREVSCHCHDVLGNGVWSSLLSCIRPPLFGYVTQKASIYLRNMFAIHVSILFLVTRL